jgi:serine/threonine-protein kinase
MDEIARWLRRVPAGPVVAVVSIVAVWFMSTRPTALAPVPDLEGASVIVAQTEAAAAGYTTRVTLKSGPGRAGTVLAQQPAPRTLLARGAAIVLFVTRGARQVGVPDVRGLPVAEARRVLREAGLTLGDVTYRPAPGREANRVITTDPPPGATVDAGTAVAVFAAT